MEKKCPSPNVLSQRPQLSSTDLSLVSWLEFLGNEQFVTPFQQCSLDLKIEALRFNIILLPTVKGQGCN